MARRRHDEQVLAQLHIAYDAHGCHLVDHIKEEYGSLLGVKPGRVWHHLDAYLTKIEGTWSLLDHPVDEPLVARLARATDAAEAFAIARWAGVAPPTLRKFLHVFLYCEAFPHLDGLKDREVATTKAMLLGVGPRACVECAASDRQRSLRR